MEELKNIEQYLLQGKYLTRYTQAYKANLHRKCQNDFKLEEGILYYRRNILNENEDWRICVHMEDEKKCVLEVSILHSVIGGHGHGKLIITIMLLL